MIKNVTRIEHKVGERVYEFFCDNDSPIGEVHDAICAFKEIIMQRILECHKVQMEQKPPEINVCQ